MALLKSLAIDCRVPVLKHRLEYDDVVTDGYVQGYRRVFRVYAAKGIPPLSSPLFFFLSLLLLSGTRDGAAGAPGVVLDHNNRNLKQMPNVASYQHPLMFEEEGSNAVPEARPRVSSDCTSDYTVITQ